MRRRIISLVLSILALAFASFTLISILGESQDTLVLLKSANYWWLLLLIPNTILMFYCAGRIWYPYVGDKMQKKELALLSYEQNFITTAVPVGEVAALPYVVNRMKAYGVNEGLSAAMFIFRYIITIATNLLGVLLAVIMLLCVGRLQNIAIPALIITIIILIAVVIIFVIGFIAISGKISFKSPKISKFIGDLHDGFTVAFSDRRAFGEAFLFGAFYSLFEDLPFLIVSTALGEPRIFLQIIVAGIAGNFADALLPNPGAVGGFEAAMTAMLAGYGVNISLAISVTVITRVLFIVVSVVVGYPIFGRGMYKIGGDMNATYNPTNSSE